MASGSRFVAISLGIERRDRVRMPWIIKDTCELDGRLSLAHHRGEMLLYARANMATHGQRLFQVLQPADGGVELVVLYTCQHRRLQLVAGRRRTSSPFRRIL